MLTAKTKDENRSKLSIHASTQGSPPTRSTQIHLPWILKTHGHWLQRPLLPPTTLAGANIYLRYGRAVLGVFHVSTWNKIHQMNTVLIATLD